MEHFIDVGTAVLSGMHLLKECNRASLISAYGVLYFPHLSGL